MDTYFKADQSFECLELALSAHHTDRGYREEAVDPSFNLVAKVRAKRLRWLGHVLRERESHHDGCPESLKCQRVDRDCKRQGRLECECERHRLEAEGQIEVQSRHKCKC